MDKEQQIEEMATVIRNGMDKLRPIGKDGPFCEDRNSIRDSLIYEWKEEELRFLVEAGYGNVELAIKEFAEIVKKWFDGGEVSFYNGVEEGIWDSEEVKEEIDKMANEFLEKIKKNLKKD